MASPSLITNRDHTLGSSYSVILPAFEGPLDLLLHLIEAEELDITEISLVSVTNQYLRTLEYLEEIEPGALADFLLVASRLLYIKSRGLLPRPHTAEEDDEESGDSLIRQLIEYRQFKNAASELKTRVEAGYRVYLRTAPAPELEQIGEKQPTILNAETDGLHRALQRALQHIPEETVLPKVQPYTVTVAEQIESVRSLIWCAQKSAIGEHPKPLRFGELLSQGTTRIEVIVTFLAVLELLKQQEIWASQEETFGEIMLTPHQPSDSQTDGEPPGQTRPS